ncbi:MAG: DUF378 domain-containing protein [Chlamydiia bacterium]|nr:DUF378 domain-containing protein [Chlamydiia bacterium]
MTKNSFGFEMTALVLLIIGGVNWGFVALFDWDLLAGFFGPEAAMTRVAYGAVGVAAVYRIILWIQQKTR